MEQPQLKQKLVDDLKQALKGGDTVRRDTIRLVMSAINNAEIAKQTKLSDGDVLGILAREIKQRQESIDAFVKGGRQDLADKEKAEMAILQGYMPAQVSHDEIVAAAQRIIGEVGARSPQDKGKVMPKIIAELKGKADGREINSVVTELLSKP